MTVRCGKQRGLLVDDGNPPIARGERPVGA